jgi:D-alanyl-D-alanine endopeptidase (penicillin-binding protein 7)
MIRGLGLITLAGVQLLFTLPTVAATSQAGPASHSVRLASAHHHSRPVSDEPSLRSSSALVVDETDGSVLYSKHADVAAPIASITKLMTALVIADAKLPLDEPIEVTKEDRSLHKGASSRLAFGTTLTRGDLLHLALMASENRAAHALGRTYPGGLDAFVHAMNAKARALGMTSSVCPATTWPAPGTW